MAEGLISSGVEAHLGGRLRSARPLGGGCIGEVYRAELSDGTPLVAKVDRDGAANLGREAYMLRYLRARTGLPVPEVLHGSETLLLMEFVEGESRFSAAAEEHAAELLAALHGVTAGAYGHERDTLIGSLDQPNTWEESWTDFFRERRLMYAARVAHAAGRLPDEDLRRVGRLAERLEDLIGDANTPSLIHGDAWRANVLAKGGRISAFLDPAIYHADPEMELAYISLFDSFGGPFMRRYAEIRPIPEAFFERRRDLYSLYPLLVHAYYFGGKYPKMVRDVLSRFGV